MKMKKFIWVRRLTRKQISEAVRAADCELHGITVEEAARDPELLCPDHVVSAEAEVPPEVAIRFYNAAIVDAQLQTVKEDLEKFGIKIREMDVQGIGYVKSMNVRPSRQKFHRLRDDCTKTYCGRIVWDPFRWSSWIDVDVNDVISKDDECKRCNRSIRAENRKLEKEEKKL